MEKGSLCLLTAYLLSAFENGSLIQLLLSLDYKSRLLYQVMEKVRLCLLAT